MREYICQYLDCDPGFERISEQDRYDVGFRFSLCPLEYFNQPSAAQYIEDVTIKISLHGRVYRSMRFNGERLNASDKIRVLYWHAVKAIMASQESVVINGDYVNSVNPSTVDYPPSQAFSVDRMVKMEFR